MRFAAANPKESGVPKSVSSEFNNADPGGKLPESKSKSDDDRKRDRYGKKG
jgi:hypothetical protein